MRSAFVTLLLLLGSLSSALAGTAKVERVDRPKATPVPEAVWKALDPQGYRVMLEDGSQLCDIWLRNDTPKSSRKESDNALYPQLASSTMVGLILFPKAVSDYKGDPVQPGFYTLRYQLLPSDGNHMGVAPSPDFLLLVPIASDPDPGAQFKFQELVNVSRKVTASQHPGVFSLVSPGDSPIIKDDQDHWIFSAKLRLADGSEMAFGLVVKGTASQ